MTATSQRRDYIRALATATALFYPLYWLFQSILGAAPALLRAVTGAPLGSFNASFMGLAIVGGGRRGAVGPEAWAVIALLTACLYAWGRRDLNRRAAIGFALTVWALALARSPLSSLYRSGGMGLTAGVLLVTALGIAVVGFLWMLPAVGERARPARALRLALVFAVPAALALAVLRLYFDYPLDFLARRELPATALLAVTGLFVGSRGGSIGLGRPEPSWRGFWVGALASVVIFSGSQQLAQAVEESERVKRETAIANAPDNRPLPPPLEKSFFKGVNFTAEWPARYDTDQARETLEFLPSFGVNSIALVPYASARLGSPELRFPLSMERDAGIRFMTSVAHAAGMRVLLKPQIWYRGGYPGDQDLHTEEDLNAFFANYRRFTEHYAKLAEETHADMFCVGVEFAKLSNHAERWREVIALAREHYSGPLTYAANFGEEFESVRFWGDLDYIGLDNYYPLPDDLSTGQIARRVEAVHGEFGKPVLFTEVGFTHHQNTYEKPWEDQPGGAVSPEVQARCYEAVFEGFHDKPWLEGMFWWKVGSAGSAGRGGGTHSPWGLPAMEVLKTWYWKL